MDERESSASSRKSVFVTVGLATLVLSLLGAIYFGWKASSAWTLTVFVEATAAGALLFALQRLFRAVGSPGARTFTHKLLTSASSMGLAKVLPQSWQAELISRLRVASLLAEQAPKESARPEARRPAIEAVDTLTDVFLIRRGVSTFAAIAMLVMTLVVYVVGGSFGRFEQGIGLPLLLIAFTAAIVVDQTILYRRIASGVFGSSLSEMRELLCFVEFLGRRLRGGDPPRPMIVREIRLPESHPATADEVQGAQPV